MGNLFLPCPKIRRPCGTCVSRRVFWVRTVLDRFGTRPLRRKKDYFPSFLSSHAFRSSEDGSSRNFDFKEQIKH